MKKNIILCLCFFLTSCFIEPKKIEDNTSVEIPEVKATPKTESNIQNKDSSKYDYIKNLKGKYAHDIGLFEPGIIKTQLQNLLGQENYNLFIQNMSVQIPIEIITDGNDEYAFISGGAPHSFGSDEACIEIDFKTEKISVGILTEAANVLYFTENDDKSQSSAKDKMATWLYEAKENTNN